MITPEIQKKKYIYYRCTNFRGICKKIYIKEETLLATLSEYFDRMTLDQERIGKITADLKAIHESESTFHEESLTALRKEQDRVQRRLSQMYDDKPDGLIDGELYIQKVREYKGRQMEIVDEMKGHEKADEAFYVTANMVMNLEARARGIFESSEVDEKRQILNLVFQNLKLDGEKLLVDMHEPFSIITGCKEHPDSWRWRESNTGGWVFLLKLFRLLYQIDLQKIENHEKMIKIE